MALAQKIQIETRLERRERELDNAIVAYAAKCVERSSGVAFAADVERVWTDVENAKAAYRYAVLAEVTR